MKKKILKMCMLIGFIIVLGTAGKSDTNDLMPFSQILGQCSVGALLMLIGFIPLKLSGDL